jgi:predicted transcriptional regulator
MLLETRRSIMAKPPLSIPDSELDVLKVLWDRGQATVREVLETLREAGHVGNKDGKPWSYATVATLLDRLETKKVVESDRTDQAFTYRPAVSVRDVQRRRVESLVDKLYQGEPGLLVLHLLKSHPLDPGQAKEVRALLEEMHKQSGSASNPNPKGSDSSIGRAP